MPSPRAEKLRTDIEATYDELDGYEMKKLNINDIATATLYGYIIEYVN